MVWLVTWPSTGWACMEWIVAWWMHKASSVMLQICGVRLGVVEQCGRCWMHLLLCSGSLGFWSAIPRQ